MDKIIHKLPTASIWLVLVMLPVLAIAGGLGIAPAGVILGLVGWSILWRLGEFKLALSQPWFWALTALLVWCCIAQLWSPYSPKAPPGNAIKLLVIVLAYCAIVTTFITIKPASRDVLSHVFMAGGVFAAGLMLIEILSGYGLSNLVDPVDLGQNQMRRQSDAEQNLGRGILTYTQFLPALIIMLITKFKRGYLLVILSLAALISAALLNRLNLPLVVMPLMSIVMAMAWKWPRFTVKLVGFSVVISILIGPLTGFLAGQMSDEQLWKLPLSLEHRIRMWAYSWEQIVQHPWIGAGFDASRSYQDTFQVRGSSLNIVIVSLHPHNAAMQIWLEIGFIGAALAALSIGFLIKPALKFAQTPQRASALCGTIIAATLFGLTTIGVWQFWWIGSIFIAIAVLQLLPNIKQ